MELLCPAGNLPALKAAIDNDADAVYIGLKDDTNARHLAGLNFTDQRLQEAERYVHRHGRKLHIAINTFAHPDSYARWQRAADRHGGAQRRPRADSGGPGDAGLCRRALSHHRAPCIGAGLRHQSGGHPLLSAIYQQQFDVARVVLPCVLSIHQVKQLAQISPVPLEVFAFGSLCIMAEGRCYLSSYLTGESPNTVGACSPARFVRWQQTVARMEARLNDVLIDRYQPDENAGYPTLCKGRYPVEAPRYHVLEEPTSLNTLALLPALLAANIASVKIEGRQRSPAYISQVTRVWRQAIDRGSANPAGYQPEDAWNQTLAAMSEGVQTTLGAYHSRWQ